MDNKGGDMTHNTNPFPNRDNDDISRETVGPEQTYPINSAADLPAAWEAAMASSDPDTARDRLVRIAFDKGWEGSLPDAARDWIGGRDGVVFSSDPKVRNVATGRVPGGIADGWPLGPVETPEEAVGTDADADSEAGDGDETLLAANVAAMRSRGLGPGSGTAA